MTKRTFVIDTAKTFDPSALPPQEEVEAAEQEGGGCCEPAPAVATSRCCGPAPRPRAVAPRRGGCC